MKEITQALGCPISLLRELAEKGVLKGADRGAIEGHTYVPSSGRRNGPLVLLLAPQPGPIWYSSRMIRDEYVRGHAGASTRFGASRKQPNDGFGEEPGREADDAPGHSPSGTPDLPPSASPSHAPRRAAGAAPSCSPSRREGDGSSSSPSVIDSDSSLRSESAAATDRGGGMAEESLGERVRRGQAGEARAILAILKPKLSDHRMGQLLGVWSRDIGPRRADLTGILREAERLTASERIAGDPIDWIGGAVRRRVSETPEGTAHDHDRPAERRTYGAGGTYEIRRAVLASIPELAGRVAGDWHAAGGGARRG